MGITSFGITFVAGKNLVPLPAMGIMALRIFLVFELSMLSLRKLGSFYKNRDYLYENYPQLVFLFFLFSFFSFLYILYFRRKKADSSMGNDSNEVHGRRWLGSSPWGRRRPAPCKPSNPGADARSGETEEMMQTLERFEPLLKMCGMMEGSAQLGCGTVQPLGSFLAPSGAE